MPEKIQKKKRHYFSEDFNVKERSGLKSVLEDMLSKDFKDISELEDYLRQSSELGEIIEEEMESFAPKVRGILEGSAPLSEKIEQFVDTYTHLLLKTPDLPIFVVSEMRMEAGRFLTLSGFREMYRSETFFQQVTEASQEKVDPRQLYTSMVSLLVYPFVMQPVLRSVYDLTTEEDFRQFVEKRKPMIVDATLSMLRGEG